MRWCRSMYNIAGTYLQDQGLPNRSPWAHDVTGRYFGWLCVQAAGEAPCQHPRCGMLRNGLLSSGQAVASLDHVHVHRELQASGWDFLPSRRGMPHGAMLSSRRAMAGLDCAHDQPLRTLSHV